MNLQQLLSYARKALDDYNMIADGDKIAVGISGGKDSLSTLIALKHLQRFYPKKFEIEAITVSLGIPTMDFSPIEKMCRDLSVPYTVVETNIAKVVFDDRKEKNPCSLCSKMRKGALNEKAVERGCNKIAYGHNRDDLLQTFLMSLLYEGRIYTFSPVTYLDRKDLYLIRPLLYVSEKNIISFISQNNTPIVKSGCPANGATKREEVKILMQTLREQYNNLDEKMFGAIKRSILEPV